MVSFLILSPTFPMPLSCGSEITLERRHQWAGILASMATAAAGEQGLSTLLSNLRNSIAAIAQQADPLFLDGDIQYHEGVILESLQIHLVEPGRIVCSLRVPPRIVDASGEAYAGVLATLVDDVGAAVFIAMDGRVRVSVDLNVSVISPVKVGEEIEIDAKLLKYGIRVGMVSVDIKNRATGELLAQGRHTMYYPKSRL